MTGRCRATPNCCGSTRLQGRALLRFPGLAGGLSRRLLKISRWGLFGYGALFSGGGSVCSMSLCRRERERGKPFREGLPFFPAQPPETREAASFRRKRLPLYSHPETFSGQGLNTRTGRKKQVTYRTSVSGKVHPPKGDALRFQTVPYGCSVEVRRAPVMRLLEAPPVFSVERRWGRFSTIGEKTMRFTKMQAAGKRLRVYGCAQGAHSKPGSAGPPHQRSALWRRQRRAHSHLSSLRSRCGGIFGCGCSMRTARRPRCAATASAA